MQPDLPSPDQILEELADKAAAQIDRLAPVAFDAALEEMVEYHRFLLSVYASETPEGAPFSYAEIPGFFRSPHQEWIRQYRRLFERAADHIGDDGDFVRKLAHLPARLLPRDQDPKLSPAVLKAILDLGPIFAHRLEAWVTKRTTISNAPGDPASMRLLLAGSDRKAYENVLPEFVGAWESLLTHAAFVYHWDRHKRANLPEAWAAYAASWPFLSAHLHNTAYLVAAAVWNEDELGASLYREALVRWPTTIVHEGPGGAEIQHRRLLFPTLFKLDWADASDRIRPFLYDYMPAPTPSQLFQAILAGAHKDVMLLTTALFVSWFNNEKQSTDIAARTALGLLRREADHLGPPYAPRSPDPRSFGALLLDVLRLDLAGERFQEGNYGSMLDDFVASLDGMTERRVVPGRIFTPSTMDDREDLLLPLLAILLAALPEQIDDPLRGSIQAPFSDETKLPAGDRSLRSLLHEFERYANALATPQPLTRAMSALAPGTDVTASAVRLRTIIDAFANNIRSQRHERLRSRPVSQEMLDRIRDAIEPPMLTAPAEITYFRDFRISTLSERGALEPSQYTINNVGKAGLVDPPMEDSSGLAQAFARTGAEAAAHRVWALFVQRPRQAMAIGAAINSPLFWRELAALVPRVGPDPILVVSNQAEARLASEILYRQQPDLDVLNRRPPARGSYVATIEDVDVYAAGLAPGVALLFSGRSLISVNYATWNNARHHVDVTYEAATETTGTLRVRYIQSVEWAEYPVFEIALDQPSDDET